MHLLLLCLIVPAWCRLVVPGKLGKSDGETAPRFKVTSTVQPVLKLRKRLGALGSALTLGCDYNLLDRTASFDTSWRDSVMGGELSLKNLSSVELRKIWLFPGLFDAATKVEMLSSVDLKTGRADAQLKLGLRRRVSRRGLSLVHAVSLDGGQGHLSLDVGATLLVPDELSLSADDVRTRSFSSLDAATFHVDFDRLDIRVEY